MDLEKGYTRTRLHRGGLAARRQRQREKPDGDPHAVISGERETLCGQVVRTRAQWPPGSMETLCSDCADELAKLAAGN
jgi:hypothetical protein